MLNFWCLWVGDKYPGDYLTTLRASIDEYCNGPHDIYCITDRPEVELKCIEDVFFVRPLPKIDPGPGKLWFHKLAVFKYAKDFGIQNNIYLDLDTLIIGDLGILQPYCKAALSMSRNWPQSGHCGWQSSLMCWNGEMSLPYDTYDDYAPLEHWGDQEYIYSLERDGELSITEIPAPLLRSYKYHCQELTEPPAGAVAVTFHGNPDYHEVDAPWVKALLSTPTGN